MYRTSAQSHKAAHPFPCCGKLVDFSFLLTILLLENLSLIFWHKLPKDTCTKCTDSKQQHIHWVLSGSLKTSEHSARMQRTEEGYYLREPLVPPYVSTGMNFTTGPMEAVLKGLGLPPR